MTTTLTLPYSRPPITSNEAARSNGRAHASTRKQMRSTAAIIAKANKVGVHPIEYGVEFYSDCESCGTWITVKYRRYLDPQETP